MLAARATSEIDLENVAEEIESLGESQPRELRSRLTTILAHLLKIAYSPAYEPLGGWRGTVRTQRRDMLMLMEQSPSLWRTVHEIFPTAYADAAEETRLSHIDLTLAPIPSECPFDLKTEILNPDWFPEPRIRAPNDRHP